MEYPHRKLLYRRIPAEKQLENSRLFLASMKERRSVRFFSEEPVEFELISNAIECASLAPSGANQQPWRFIAVRDSWTKHLIREAAEAEEKQSYDSRMPTEWLEALAPLGTDWHKDFLETAPYLIVVFRLDYGITEDRRMKHYYVQESVGIACGFLLAALHQAGLVCLTHTPSPMGFLAELLERAKNEWAFLLIPVGYPATDATVPDIEKKPLDVVMVVK